MFFVDKWVHSNSLINVQPEEKTVKSMKDWKTCATRQSCVARRSCVDEVCVDHALSRRIMRWQGKSCVEEVRDYALLRRIMRWRGTRSTSRPRLTSQNLLKCQMPKKKSAWTGLDRVNLKKNLQSKNVKIEKSAWTGLDKVKRGLFSGKCL
jgi:hypothetical protein